MYTKRWNAMTKKEENEVLISIHCWSLTCI